MKMGKVPILDTINKIPGGLMVVPLVLGVLTNTFFPGVLNIGSFTTAFFKNGAFLDLRRSCRRGVQANRILPDSLVLARRIGQSDVRYGRLRIVDVD